jgi:hypothetical protein
MARTIPPDPKRSETGIGLSIAVTILLALLGFVGSQMIQPILQALGIVVAYEALCSLHRALPDQLKKMLTDLTGADRRGPVLNREPTVAEARSAENGARRETA